MAIVQTYESHLVGIGEPLSGRSDGSDTIKFLAFAQGFSYQYQKDIKRFKQVGKDDFYFNRQTDWADVSVNITQFDSIDDNYDILKNLNIFPSSEEFTSGTYYPFLKNVITGGRNSNGSPIYFITDTGERARDVLGNDNAISRDFTVIDPCYLSSVSWSVAKNTVASFEYSFVGNYMRTGSYTENGDIVWNHIINTGNGDSYISTTGNGDVSSTSNEIDVNNVSGLFIGGYTNVSGAPDLGEIRSISWSVSIDRSNVQGLGNPMKYDRKISPEHIGQLTIEYNYEGQEFDLANVADIPYNIRIESKSKNNFFRIFKIENALIESAQLNSSTSGEPDSYSVTLSFKVNKNGGLFYDIQKLEIEEVEPDPEPTPDPAPPILPFRTQTIEYMPEYQIIQLGQDIDGEAAGDFSGWSVSMNSTGDRVAIGAYGNDANGSNSGHVRVYEWNGSSWTRLGSDIDGETTGDRSGHSVSMNSTGDRVAIGAILNYGNGTYSGHTRIYEWNGSSWTRLGFDIDGEALGDNSGWSVSMNAAGNRVAIGALYNDGNGSNSGHVRIYEWRQYTANDIGLYNYYSKSQNNTQTLPIIITESFNTTPVVGNYYWTQLGFDINGELNSDRSGYSVSMNSTGNRVAIGSILNDGNGTDSGHVRIYEWRQYTANDIGLYNYYSRAQNNTQTLPLIITQSFGNAPIVGNYYWTQLGFDIDGEAAVDASGHSVSMNSTGDRVAIGAYGNDANGSNSGHVRVYEWNGSSWTRLGSDIDGEALGDNSGYSVSMNSDGDRVAIGAIYNDGNGSDSGHVRVYEWNGSSWVKLGQDIDGETATNYSGRSISMNSSGNRVIIGAQLNDGTTGNSSDNRGHARIYQINQV